MANKPEQTATLGPARLSYTHLFKPYARDASEEPRYSTTLLIPKTDIRSKQLIDMAIEAAKQTGLVDQYQGVIPPVLATPVHDGDGVRVTDGMPFPPECKGHWVFTASSKNAPSILDQTKQPIIRESEIYSGAYAYVSVTFFPYNAKGKKGVGCALNHVMKYQDGEPLAGGISADAAFANIPVAGTSPAPFGGVPQTAVQYDPITGRPLGL